MAYCDSCGRFVADGAKFCSYCGSPMQPRKDNTDRQQEYAGKVVKCPACGTEIPSFTAFCPGCGHEINSARASSAIKDFSDKISQYDLAIANSPSETKKGWKTWSAMKKFGWVILNIYTLCIPLVIYLLLPFLGIGGMAALTPEEKKKVSFINHFAFPNDRENILEGLLYIKEQMEILAEGKIDRNTARWIKIWKNKASQLFDRAEIMFKDDMIANDAYADILASEKKVKKALLVRVIVAVIAVALFAALVGSRGNGKKANSTVSESGNGKKANSAVSENKRAIEGSPTISEGMATDAAAGIYTYQIRNYVGKNLASVGRIQGEKLIDEYGEGELHIIVMSEGGKFISEEDHETMKQYVVDGQSLPAGTDITIVHERDSSGEPYGNLVDYQSYDEIVLSVAPVGEEAESPEFTELSPTLDRHTYHIRDYVGRNAASIGRLVGSNRIDEYGNGELRLVFTSPDGTYVDSEDSDDLKRYVVVGQDIAPNTKFTLMYETDSRGEESDYFIQSQNYEEINLSVRRIED